MPPALIASLGLRWKCFGRGILADGSECLFDVYEATVVWDGKGQRVLVNEADTDPLVGMALLSGYELKMQVRGHRAGREGGLDGVSLFFSLFFLGPGGARGGSGALSGGGGTSRMRGRREAEC